MITIIFGKPLVFWLGFLALIFFIAQITLGILMHKGKKDLYGYHKINAVILSVIVLIHLIFGLTLYL